MKSGQPPKVRVRGALKPLDTEPVTAEEFLSIAKHILDVHRELTDLIESRDAPAARRLMDDHVKMIRARRVSEAGAAEPESCC